MHDENKFMTSYPVKLLRDMKEKSWMQSII